MTFMPRPLAVAAILVLVTTTFAPRAGAGGSTYVRDLSQQTADVRWRHSGHQGGRGSAEYFGRELATGDFNHDGLQDLAVSADTDTAATDTSFGRGFVYVYFGKGSSYPAVLDPAEQLADCRIYGEGFFAHFGTELAVGDFDGDGIDDLAVSQIENTTVYKGAVFLIAGAEIGSNAELHMDQGQYITKISGRTTGTRGDGKYLFFGLSLTAGDFNGDGISDVAAGATGGYGIDGSRPESGDVSVVLGRTGEWPHEIVAASSNVDLFILGRRGAVHLGSELAAGDVDGDGRDELIAASFGSDGPDDTRSFSGDVCVFSFGPGSPIALPAAASSTPAAILWDTRVLHESTRIWGPNHGSRIGSSASDGGGRQIAVGDFDGDGYNDVIVGAPFDGDVAQNSKNPGSVFAVWGGQTLTNSKTIDLVDVSNGQNSDASLVAVGGEGESLGDTVRLADFNGDGRQDLIAGAPDAAGATGYVAVFGGRARVNLPASGPLAPVADAVVEGSDPVWRSGEDAIYLDATFAGEPMLAIGAPNGGYVPLGGRGYAGEVDGVLAAPIREALPRVPSILAQSAVVVTPNATASVQVEIRPGSGIITSVSSPDLPAFASLQPVDAAAGLYLLVLSPSVSDRGVHQVTISATDSSGASAARRVGVTVGYAPTITNVKLKRVNGSVFKLIVDGSGFATGEAIVTVDGFETGPVKYPSKFAENAGVTVRRLQVKNSQLSTIIIPGDTSFVRITNPREGLTSLPFPVNR